MVLSIENTTMFGNFLEILNLEGHPNCITGSITCEVYTVVKCAVYTAVKYETYSAV